MRKSIHIGALSIEENEKTTRLNADVYFEFQNHSFDMQLFYEVGNEWGQYFVTELSDAFVLPLLELAMEKGCDILFEMPMSEDLKYQLDRYLIPLYSQNIKELYEISLIGPVSSEEVLSENVTGTGFSGGVDSFYSVLSHLDTPYPSKNVTHLMLAVNGAAMTGISSKVDKRWFDKEMNRFEPIIAEIGLKLIGVNSNISLLNEYKTILKGGDSITTSGFVHALRKLFGTYYWASAYKGDVLKFVNFDGGYMEPFSVPMVNSGSLKFYHDGCQVSRIEKVKSIADNYLVQKSLTVCGQPSSCGICAKCLRTMSELYAVEKLDLYRSIFPVDDYKKHFKNRIARELAIDHPPFTTDIIQVMNKNNRKIPFLSWVASYLFFRPYYFLKKKLRGNKLMIHLYYDLGADSLMGEKHSQEYIDAIKSGKRK